MDLDALLISESNYSSQYFDESYIMKKNDKTRQLYQLEEKENDIYSQQEELARKMINLIYNNQKQFKHKYYQLQRDEDLYHLAYNNLNDKILNLLSQYNSNKSNYFINSNYNYSNLDNLNSIFDAFANKWIFPQNKPLNNKAFRAKCDIKSCEKKIKKSNNYDSNINLKNKSLARTKSKTFRKSMTSTLNNFKTKNNNNTSLKKMPKTERTKYNNLSSNKISQKEKKRAKSRTGRTSTRATMGNISNSIFEENKINEQINDKINNDIIYNLNNLENKNNNENNDIIKRVDYSKYLTKENFYPKTFRIERNNEIINNDKLFYETKTSFREKKLKEDLYNRAFKKCNYQSYSFKNLNNPANYV